MGDPLTTGAPSSRDRSARGTGVMIHSKGKEAVSREPPKAKEAAKELAQRPASSVRRPREREFTPHPKKQGDSLGIDWTKIRRPAAAPQRKPLRCQNADGSQHVFTDARQYLSHQRTVEDYTESDTASTPTMPDATYQNSSLRQSRTSHRERR